MTQESSYRQILRATSILGSASVLNLAVSLVRSKVAALLLGPNGIGLIGLFQSLVATASLVVGLGTSTVGTRQIAEANGRNDIEAVSLARKALFYGVAVLAFIGTFVFWFLRDFIAENLFQGKAFGDAIGWLSIGVALTVFAGAQTALMNGLRRIRVLAQITVISGVISSFLGCSALALWGSSAVVFFVVCVPLCSVVVGVVFIRRCAPASDLSVPISKLWGQWSVTARIGLAFMVSGLVGSAGQLFVRSVVQESLGSEGLGLFQASWSISTMYIAFVLSAMGSDYYPRLTEAFHDKGCANRLVNEQTEISLMLSAPLFFFMLGFAPVILKVLYSSEFLPATQLLRLQVIGDVLKVISWPLGFLILASGSGKTYMGTESLSTLILAVTVWIGLPHLGLKATSLGYILMYLVLTPVIYWVAQKRTGFFWSRQVIRSGILICLISVLIILVGSLSEIWAMLASAISCFLFLGYGVIRISEFRQAEGRKGKVVLFVRRLLRKIGARHD